MIVKKNDYSTTLTSIFTHDCVILMMHYSNFAFFRQ